MPSPKQIVLVGGGGHCAVVIDVLARIEGFQVVGIADRPERLGDMVAGVEIRYTDRDLPDLRRNGVEYALVCVGATFSSRLRKRLFYCMEACGYSLPTVVDPDAVIMKGVSLGDGTVVMPGAVIGTEASVGCNCIINTGAVVEHHCVVHDHVHVAPRAVLSGSVEVGANTFLGAGSCVIQSVRIGADTTVGAGAVVVSPLPNSVVAYGNPARIVRRNELDGDAQ